MILHDSLTILKHLHEIEELLSKIERKKKEAKKSLEEEKDRDQ